MPTYQYACRSCDHRFEAVQGFHEDTLTVCPDCSAPELRKLFGNVGVVFKGSGFYRNDSRAAAGKSATKSAPDATKKEAATPAPAAAAASESTSKATPAATASKAPATAS